MRSSNIELPLIESERPVIDRVSSERTGYLYMLFTSITYVVQLMTGRFSMHVYHIPISVNVFALGLIQTSLAALYLHIFDDVRRLYSVPSQFRLIFIARIIFGALGFALSMAMVAFIPAGDASGIFLATPAMTMLFSVCLLHERMSGVDWAATLLSVTGVVMLAVPYGPEAGVSGMERLLGVSTGLLAAAADAFAFIASRFMGEEVHSMTLVAGMGVALMIGGIGTGALAGIEMFLSLGRAGALGGLYAILSGIMSFLAGAAISRGLQLCRAGPGTIIAYSCFPLTYVISYFTLKEVPSFLHISGSGFLLAAAVIIGLASAYTK